MLPPLYDLVLTDREPPSDLSPEETFIAADLGDPSAIEHAATGVDGILHFGGQAVEAPWETILNSNIAGTYNLFEAARKQKVRRVVFASTNHVVGFYPRAQTIGPQVLPLPDSRYGVSKAFGEALGALYAHKHSFSVFCIRIGHVSDRPADERQLAIWLKPGDWCRSFGLALSVRASFTKWCTGFRTMPGLGGTIRAQPDLVTGLKANPKRMHKRRLQPRRSSLRTA